MRIFNIYRCHDLFIHRRCFVRHTHFITYFGTHTSHASSSYIVETAEWWSKLVKWFDCMIWPFHVVNEQRQRAIAIIETAEMRQVNDIMAHSGAIVKHWPHITWNILWQYISRKSIRWKLWEWTLATIICVGLTEHYRSNCVRLFVCVCGGGPFFPIMFIGSYRIAGLISNTITETSIFDTLSSAWAQTEPWVQSGKYGISCRCWARWWYGSAGTVWLPFIICHITITVQGNVFLFNYSNGKTEGKKMKIRWIDIISIWWVARIRPNAIIRYIHKITSAFQLVDHWKRSTITQPGLKKYIGPSCNQYKYLL